RQRERIDRVWRTGQLHLPGAALEEGGEFPIAAADVEDEGEGMVLLRVGDEEVEQERLAGAGGAKDEGVADVLVMQVPVVGRVLRGAEDGEALAIAEVRTDGV